MVFMTVYPFPFVIKLFIDLSLQQAALHPLTIFDA